MGHVVNAAYDIRVGHITGDEIPAPRTPSRFKPVKTVDGKLEKDTAILIAYLKAMVAGKVDKTTRLYNAVAHCSDELRDGTATYEEVAKMIKDNLQDDLKIGIRGSN